MHTIHDIAFEVTVHNDNQRISWEQYYADFLKNKLLPRVEILCDDWSRKHPNTKCSIDSMEVNVEIENLNLEELQKEIIQQINRQLISIQSDGSSNDGKLKAVISHEASTFDGLLQYLSSGVLPSNISVKTFKEWLGNLTEFNSTEKTKLNTLFATSTDNTIQRMLSLLRNDYVAFSALIETSQSITTQYVQLELSFFKKFFKAICNGFQLSYSDETADIWYKTLGKTSSLTQFSKTFLQLLQPKVTSEGKRLTNKNPRYVIIALLQAIIQDEKGKVITISVSKIGTIVKDEKRNSETTQVSKKAKTKTTEKSENQKDENRIEAQKNREGSKAENNMHSETSRTDKKVDKNKALQAKTKRENEQRNSKDLLENKTSNEAVSHLAEAKKTKEITGEIAFTTEKAGLILVHPFLTTFFKGVNLVTAENEINDVEKACLLLHYLATETEVVTDVELTLEKILLGIPVATIVDCETILTEEEKALCDELLQAVLAHWVVLKKSTINTLRDMFLKRDGHLTTMEDHIKLKIERLAQDILLEKVPWNISLFRLKWMEKIVHVEW